MNVMDRSNFKKAWFKNQSSDRGLLFITSQAAVHGKDRAKLVKAYSSLCAKVVHPIMFLIASSNTECSLIFLHKCQEEIDKVS